MMKWEELTADEFRNAVNQNGVCVIPMGVIEKHGSHLPLATDMIIGRTIAEMASAIEPFVIFPYYFFGQINEARHVPGTIALSPRMQMELLDEVVKEIRRNGFRKIVLLESHGGNLNFLDYYLQGLLHEKRDYMVYKIGIFELLDNISKKIKISPDDGHAALTETEFVMAARPDLVHMDKVNPVGAINQHRLDHLHGAKTPVSWYCDHPLHQDGDPTEASLASGKKKYRLAAEYVAEIIRRIKADNQAITILNEYYSSCDKIRQLDDKK